MLDQESSIKSLFEYYQALGVNEVFSNMPENWLDIRPDFSLKRQPGIKVVEQISTQDTPTAHIQTEIQTQTESIATQLNKCLSLADLKQYVQSVNDFSIKRTAMNFVFASGPESADIMIINDFPFESDDRTGDAYSGEMGALIRKMLGAIKLDFDQIYATYLLPWRPPGNRTPSKKELEFFSDILKRHISLKSPKHIFVMGNSSLKAISGMGQANLGSYRLKANHYTCPISQKERVFYVTYNPTHLQKFPEYKKRAWEDLQFFENEVLKDSK